MKNSFPAMLVLVALLLAACATPPATGRTEVPSVVSEVPAQYPLDLRKQGTTGSATVDFIVTTQGDVANAFAIEASNPAFGQAAVAAVSRWKFKPGIRDGVAVNTHLQVPVYFNLTDEQPVQPAPQK